MTDWIGADPEGLRELARTFSDAADLLQSTVQVVDAAVGSVVWHGVDGERFRLSWTDEHRQLLTATESAFRERSAVVLRNRDEQIGASSVGGVGAGVALAAAGAASAAAAQALGRIDDFFGGGPDLPGNPSGEPHVVSSDMVMVQGDVSLVADGGVGAGFLVERLSDGTVRVTSLGEVRGGMGVGVGGRASLQWGEESMHAGAVLEGSALGTVRAGTTWIVDDPDEAQNLIGSVILDSQLGGRAIVDVGTSMLTPFLHKSWEEDLGVDAVRDAVNYRLPKPESRLVVREGELSGAAILGLGPGGDVTAAVGKAEGFERHRDGSRTFHWGARAEAAGAVQSLGLGPPGAGDVSGAASVQASLDVDDEGRPTAIAVVTEVTSGSSVHRRTTTIDLTDPRLAGSAADLVDGLSDVRGVDDDLRDLLGSAAGATSHVDERLEAGGGSYGGAISAGVIAKAGGGLRVDVQSLDVVERTVTGQGRRP